MILERDVTFNSNLQILNTHITNVKHVDILITCKF